MTKKNTPPHGHKSAMQRYLKRFKRDSIGLAFAERCLLIDPLPEAAQEYKATGRAQPEFWSWCGKMYDQRNK